MSTSDPHAATTKQSLLGLMQHLSTCMGTPAASVLSARTTLVLGKPHSHILGIPNNRNLPEIINIAD